jgi:hypothetical protein
MDTTISFCYNNQGSVGGYGSYVTLSDERTKTHIKPLDLGLQAILDITPISFTRARNGKADAGFSAQNVQHVIPQAVNAFGYDLPDDDDPDSTSPALGVSLDPIVAAMLNGMKELAARVTQLESKQA